MIPTDCSPFIHQPPPFLPASRPPSRCQKQLHQKVFTTRLRACTASPPLDKLLNAAKHQLSRAGLEITSMEWDSRVLTFFVQRPDGSGVSADDCADASILAGQLIEKDNYLGNIPYTLQVSTAGTSNVLTHQHEMDAFRGFPVHVNTTEPVNGKKLFWGTLVECTSEFVAIAVKGRVIELKRHIVDEIRLCTAQQVQEAMGK